MLYFMVVTLSIVVTAWKNIMVLKMYLSGNRVKVHKNI